jgi:aminopeptidase N
MLALRRMAYPTPEAWRATDGSQVRFADTDEFVAIAEEVSGRDLDWFFDVYVHEAELPELELTRREGELDLAWKTPEALPFPMPVDVRIDGRTQRVELPDGRATVPVPAGAEVAVDSDRWILMNRDGLRP